MNPIRLHGSTTQPNRTMWRAVRWLVPFVAPSTVLAACGGTSATTSDAGSDAGKDSGSKCVQFTPASKESDIAAAVATTKDGECIEFAAGTYHFDNQLAFGTGNDVTMSGAGLGKTIFDFSKQVAGDDGIFAQSIKNLTLKDFTVENTPNDAIKTLSVTGVTFDGIEVLWMAKDPTTHGSYGVYPVQSKDVLVQNCKISGANDTGIYIGQSQEIVVRNNEVFGNVAGIEIENSFYAEVYGNSSHDNTAGILVFALPGLQQDSGHDVLVHSNMIMNNNGLNFAVKSDIVAILPSGTGSFVMACDHVEFYDNTYVGNMTGALAIISYLDAQIPVTDKNYDPYPSYVYTHDDKFMGNGTLPDIDSTFGFLLISGEPSFPGMRVADWFYDGVVDPKLPAGKNPAHICEQEPNANAVCDLELEKLDKAGDNLPAILSCTAWNKSPFYCKLPAVKPVTFPGLTP